MLYEDFMLINSDKIFLKNTKMPEDWDIFHLGTRLGKSIFYLTLEKDSYSDERLAITTQVGLKYHKGELFTIVYYPTYFPAIDVLQDSSSSEIMDNKQLLLDLLKITAKVTGKER